MNEATDICKKLIENLPLGLFILQDEGMVFCNKAFENVSGYSFEYFKEKTTEEIMDLIKSEHEDLALENYKKGQRWLEVPGSYDIKMRRRDGEEVWLNISSRTINYEGKSATEVIVRDITQNKEIKQKLARSEEKYRKLYETAFDGILMIEGHKFVECNEVARKMFNLKKGEINGLYPWEISPEIQPDGRQSKEKAIEVMEKAYSGVPQRFYWKHKSMEGNEFDVEVSLNLLSVNGNKYLIVAHRDVTEKLKSKAELEEKIEIINNTPDAIVTTDLQGVISFWNKGAEEMYGYSSEEMINENASKLYWQKDLERLSLMIEKLRAGESINNMELEVLTKGNRTLKVLASLIPIKDRKGNVVGIAGITKDITPLREAEEKIKDSERRYRTLFENMHTGFGLHKMIYDEEGNPVDYVFVEVNKSFERLLGIKKEEIIGKRVTEVFRGIEKDSANWIKKYGNVAKTGNPIEFQAYSESIKRWYHVSAFCPEKGFFATVFNDITEQKRIYEKVRKSEEDYRLLSDNISQGLYSTKQGFIYRVNKAMCDLFGYSKDELIGMPLWNLARSEIIEDTKKRIFEKIMGEDYSPLIVECQRKNGTLLTAEISLSQNEGRGPKEDIYGFITDITDKIKAEEKIKSHNKELQNSKEFLQDVIDSATDMIFSITKKGKITSWNPSSEMITGYKYWEVVGKNLKELDVIDDFRGIESLFNEEVSSKRLEVGIKSKEGNIRSVLFSISRLKSINELEGFVFTGTDTTPRISTVAEFGKSYLLKDSSIANDIFLNQASPNAGGIYVSRNVPESVERFRKKKKIKTILLDGKTYSNKDEWTDLIYKIKECCPKECGVVLFLDRIDYLINMHDFKEFIRMIYTLNDFIRESKNMLILNLNTKIIDPAELILLEEEFENFPEVHEIFDELSPELLQILELINNNSKRGVSTSFKHVRNHFKISNVTTRKRLNELADENYLDISKEGRDKHLILTAKALKFLEG